MAKPLSSGVQIASGGDRRAHARRTRLSGAVTLAKGSSIARRFHDHEDGRLSLVWQRRPCVDQGDQISVRIADVLRLTAGAIAGVLDYVAMRLCQISTYRISQRIQNPLGVKSRVGSSPSTGIARPRIWSCQVTKPTYIQRLTILGSLTGCDAALVLFRT